MTLPFKLFRLQQIDSQLDSVALRIKDIEKMLFNNEDLIGIEHQALEIENKLIKQQEILRHAEENVQAQHRKIEQTETSLYGGKIQNPKELQDFQNESVSLRKYLTVLEDRQLEAMIFYEELEEENEKVLTSLQEKRSQFVERNNLLIIEKGVLIKERNRLHLEKEVAQKSIPSEELSLYELLRKQRSGIAVSRVIDKSCSSCGATLNVSLLQSATSLEEIARCSSCGRILYGG